MWDLPRAVSGNVLHVSVRTLGVRVLPHPFFFCLQIKDTDVGRRASHAACLLGPKEAAGLESSSEMLFHSQKLFID